MRWEDLSISEKDSIISQYVQDGIDDLELIKKYWQRDRKSNRYDIGGYLNSQSDRQNYLRMSPEQRQQYIESFPENLREAELIRLGFATPPTITQQQKERLEQNNIIYT